MYDRLTKMFRPRVERSYRDVVKAVGELYTTYGSSAVIIANLSGVKDTLYQLHATAAINNANRTRRYLAAQTKSAYTDRNAMYEAVVCDYLEANGLSQMVQEISDTLREQILQTILKGEAAGWGVDKIVRELNAATFPKWMAQRVVRTELAIAGNTGAMVAATDVGIECVKEWISATLS